MSVDCAFSSSVFFSSSFRILVYLFVAKLLVFGFWFLVRCSFSFSSLRDGAEQ